MPKLFQVNYKPLLIAFSLAVPRLFLQAQSPYYFKHYQVEQGLSNNKVMCIAQDKKGFMWFGTIDGLNRFDGYTFKTFRNTLPNPKSLGNNTVNCLYSDKDDKLWIGTAKGIYIFDPVYESFELLPFTANQPVRSIAMDSKENVWFILGHTLFRYNKQNNHVHSYASAQFHATSICTMSNGTVWVSAASGLIRRYNPGTDDFTSFDVFDRSRPSSTSSKWIENIYDTKKGSLLIGTLNQGIKLFDTSTGRYRQLIIYNHDKTEIYAKGFMQYADNEFWAATENGIFIYDMTTGSCSSLRMDYSNPFSISDNANYALYKDKEGGVWTGSRFGGINYYPFPYTYFNKYFSQPAVNSIKGNGVHEICPDVYGNLWIGTEDAGLNKLDPATHLFKHFEPDGKKGSISYYNIHGLLADSNDLWIGTYQYGIDRMNIRTEKVIKHYTIGKYAYNSNFIVYLFKTRSNDILAGTWEGLYKYNRSTDMFSPVPGFTFQTQSILEDEKGILWICTLGNGVYMLDPRTGAIQNFRHDPQNPYSLCNNMVNGQFRDSKNILWFATEEGLCKYDQKNNIFHTYDVKNGFPSNFLFKILEDKENNLWISTTKGLVCFNPLTESVKTFTTASGLLNDQFNWNSAYKDSTGRMYFGSIKGLISFIPEKFTANKIIPPVYITGIQAHNKEISIGEGPSDLKRSITCTNRITLPHHQSTISIGFAALSYVSSEMNEYAYKMEGLDKEWTFLKSNRKAYFTELPPGIYTFKVKASNSSDIWNPHETTLQIEILPPFWNNKWAYLFYAMTGIGIIYAILRNNHHKMSERNKRKMERLEHEKEKELYQNKIDFFTHVAHEIRTPLTLIRAPMEDIMNYSDKVPEIINHLRIMERNTNRLLGLSEQLLDFRQVEAKGFSLNFELTNICELLQDIHSSFQPLAEQHHLHYSLQLPVKDFYTYADRDSIQKIVSNLYSNAIKYADKRVEITFHHTAINNTFSIEVKNDGFLIPDEMKDKIFEPFFRLKETNVQKGTGIGLAISRTLAELHKGRLELKPATNKMNIFVFELPVQKENTVTGKMQTATQKNNLYM